MERKEIVDFVTGVKSDYAIDKEYVAKNFDKTIHQDGSIYFYLSEFTKHGFSEDDIHLLAKELSSVAGVSAAMSFGLSGDTTDILITIH